MSTGYQGNLSKDPGRQAGKQAVQLSASWGWNIPVFISCAGAPDPRLLSAIQ